MARRVIVALVFVLVASGAVVGWVWWHAQPKPIGSAYVGMANVSLWDGGGPVRRRLESLAYGERLTILNRYNDLAEVRTPKGKVGWVDQANLIDPGVWRSLRKFAGQVRAMTVQAKGHTSVLSNVRIGPGISSARVGQLRRNTPVEILSRAVVGGGAGTNPAPDGSRAANKKDWLLVRARTPQVGEIAGWVLGDFIADDPPAALLPYISAAGMRPVAWFRLRKVNDPTTGPEPFYLVAGTSGPEGQPCDFTMLRVYTWSVVQHRYATAFVRNDLCGRLPVHVTFESGRQRGVLFDFQNLGLNGAKILTYRMRNTIVRQVPSPAPPANDRGRSQTRGSFR